MTLQATPSKQRAHLMRVSTTHMAAPVRVSASTGRVQLSGSSSTGPSTSARPSADDRSEYLARQAR